MAYYNLTNVTDANNTLQLAKSLSEMVGGYWFGIMLLLGTYILVFVGTKGGFANKTSLVAAAGVTALVALPLYVTGLINYTHGLMALAVLVITVLYAWLTASHDSPFG